MIYPASIQKYKILVSTKIIKDTLDTRKGMSVGYCFGIKFSVVTAHSYNPSFFLTTTTGDEYDELEWTIHFLCNKSAIYIFNSLYRFRRTEL